ncbi:MAG: chromate efflux transporter [Actinobacteria bacterium]|nr:MAG: chromate efflux transporter [Actinomycetota bacterium]
MAHDLQGSVGPSFGDALRFWLKLGFVNFGGPTGQIAIMHEELVTRRRWLGEDRFLHALSFCLLLPGPEAQQLAIYTGWLLNGTEGGIAAGVLFVAPAAVLMTGLAWLYAAGGELPIVSAIFQGLAAAVVGIVAAAMVSIGGRAVRGRVAAVLAALAFLAIFVVGVPFPIVVLAAAGTGLALGPGRLGVTFSDEGPDRSPSPAPRRRRTLVVLTVGLAVWWAPVLAVVALTGPGSIYPQESLFFSQVAVISFGGAYAVLAYVAHEVVRRFGLSPDDVVAGLALAETTPGPLILVVEFYGFLAAYRNPGTLAPAVAGAIGAVVTVWATFAPCFLWVFLGAPWVERLRTNRALRGALAAVTAAVVGVIGSLALTVAANVLFNDVQTSRPFFAAIPRPVWSSLDVPSVVVGTAAFVAIRRFRVNVAWVALGGGLVGLVLGVVR